MGDVESEQSQIEFEISNIDEPKVADNLSKPIRSSSRPRFSPRQRRLQLTITSAIVVLAVIFLLVSTAPVRELARNVWFPSPPTPTPTLFPGVDLFYIQGTPSWGHFSLDGHPIARLPQINIDPPLRLSRGQHVLGWSAEPFQDQSCTLTIPGRYMDTCSPRETVQLNSELSAWIIRFAESLNTLPNEQRTALIQAAQTALDTHQLTDTVRPGELYVLPPQNPACQPGPGEPMCYATAKQALRATLNLHLDTDTASNESCAGQEPSCPYLNQQNCHLFCTDPVSRSSISQEWDVSVMVRPTWEFAGLDGRILERDVPDNSLRDYTTGQMKNESFVSLRITWDSVGWHVIFPVSTSVSDSNSFNPTCAPAQDEVLSLEPPADASGPIYPLWQFVSSTLPAAGCLAVGNSLQKADNSPTQTHSVPLKAYCLHRFGILLAANDLAHRFWPYLPLADAYELRLAQQLASLSGGSAS